MLCGLRPIRGSYESVSFDAGQDDRGHRHFRHRSFLRGDLSVVETRARAVLEPARAVAAESSLIRRMRATDPFAIEDRDTFSRLMGYVTCSHVATA